MKSKNQIRSMLIYAIVFAAYNLLVFTIFKLRGPVFWVSYAFMLVAFAAQIISMVLVFKEKTVEAVFFGIPLASLSVFYFFAELFVSVVFMLFAVASFGLAIVVQALLLAAFMVMALLALLARDSAVEVDQRLKTNVSAIRTLQVDVEMMARKVQDPALKKKLERLAENIRYSDPITNDTVADAEARLRTKLEDLRLLCAANHVEPAQTAVAQAQDILEERNARVKISK